MMTKRVIILQPILQHQLNPILRALPPRGHDTPRWFAAGEVFDEFVTFVHYRCLLFQGHVFWVFVGVAVESDFVACGGYHATFFGEGL